MTEERQPPAGAHSVQGVWGGIKGSLHDTLELLRVRLALLGVEAQGHAQAVLMAACLGVAATMLLCLGLGFMAVLLTVLWWDTHRVVALAMFTAVFFTLGGLAAWAAWRGLRQQSPWFAASTRELARDVQKLRS